MQKELEKKTAAKLAETKEVKPDNGEIDEGGDDGDTVEKVEADIAEMIEKKLEISEAIFAKYVNAQQSGTVSKTDTVAIAKLAGLPESVGEQIALQYTNLISKYPYLLTNAVMKTKPDMGQKAQVIAPAKRRLLVPAKK